MRSYSKANGGFQDLGAAHISTMRGHPSNLHTDTKGESILYPEMCYTGFAPEVQRPFIPHTIQTLAPSALAFTAGANIRRRKVHLKKPQIGVMFLGSHKSLAESQTQNAFPFSINNTGVPPGDRNRYNFKLLEVVCVFFNVPVFQNLVKW